MRNIFTCLFIALVFVSSGNAQTIKGFVALLKFGNTSVHNSEKLFKKIGPSEISGFSEEFSLAGAEIYYKTGRIILVLEGHGGVQNISLSDGTYGESLVRAAHAKIGWIISENENSWIYPSLGSGTAGVALTTYSTIDGESENRQNQILLSPSFDFGINADILVARAKQEKRKYSGLIVGMRGGYRAAFNSNNWRNRDGEKLNNMPSYGHNAFYVSVVVGEGWFWKK